MLDLKHFLHAQCRAHQSLVPGGGRWGKARVSVTESVSWEPCVNAHGKKAQLWVTEWARDSHRFLEDNIDLEEADCMR